MHEQARQMMETAARPIAQSLFRYLQLPTWLDQKVQLVVGQKRTHTFHSTGEFWRAVAAEELQAGDRIRFRQAFVTEWLPRLPGASWLDTGPSNALALSRGRITVVGTASPLGGSTVGVVRLPFGSNDAAYAALGLVSVDGWACDQGIPLLVSSSVYDAFLAKVVDHNAVECDLEGVLCFGQFPLLAPELLATLGGALDPNLVRLVTRAKDIPPVYIAIASPLDTRFRSHNNHPPGYLWTLVRHTYNTHTITVLADGQSPRLEVFPADPYALYTLLTYKIQLNDPEAIKACATALQSGGVEIGTNPLLPVPRPRATAIATEILTDFDGRRPRLQAGIPLAQGVWHDAPAVGLIKRTFDELQSLALAEQAKMTPSTDQFE